VQTNIPVGTLPSVNAPGCAAPTIFDSGFEYWEIVWPSPCVDPGESVSFELPTFTMIYGYYWTPGVPVVSAVHPAGPPSDYLRIATAAFIKGVTLVQNAPGCPPPAFNFIPIATIEVIWSSACVDPGEKVSIHIGAPGPVTSASSNWGPVGGVSFDPLAGGSPSGASMSFSMLAAVCALSVCVFVGAAWQVRRRRMR